MTTLQFDKKLVCGNDFVAVRVIENCENLKVGNIYLPSTSKANERLAHCQITDIGKHAAEIHGLKTGDYVLIDRLATFAWTAPTAALKYDSVICKTNAENTEHFPLKDTLFVEPDKKDDVTNVNGIYMAKYADRLNLGTVIKTGFEKSSEYPFEPGDRVMLVKGGDVVQLDSKVINIYKKDMIVCTVED